ncbi:MAG: hypothetical protein JRN52_02315 [Nitrososphaerota archaeon]|nr:hypothetical protein [Nitrososphaerota archaeon]
MSYGDEIILLGRIVGASIDKEALKAKDPYKYLKMLVFLEDGTFGTITKAEKLTAQARSQLDALKKSNAARTVLSE